MRKKEISAAAFERLIWHGYLMINLATLLKDPVFMTLFELWIKNQESELAMRLVVDYAQHHEESVLAALVKFGKQAEEEKKQ
jgi:hypothetical protein